MKLHTPARRATRSAIATVEFALIAPILAVMVLGMCELGRAIMIKEALNDSARRGCKTGTFTGKTNANITTEAQNLLKDAGISGYANSHVEVAVNDDWTKNVSTAKRGDKISVRVWMKFSDASWTGSYFLSNQSIASETLVMRHL